MFGFLIAIAAGFATPMFEASLARPVQRFLAERIEVEDGEVRVIAFIIALLIAGLLSAIFHSGTTLWIVIGAALGYFGTRIVRLAQTALANR